MIWDKIILVHPRENGMDIMPADASKETKGK